MWAAALTICGCSGINPDYDPPTGAAAEVGDETAGDAGTGDGDSGDGDSGSATAATGDGTSGDGDGTTGDGDGDGTTGDGDGTTGDGDGTVNPPPFSCDPTDPSLVGCFSFDAIDAGFVRDGSSYANDMMVDSGTLAPGLEGQAAAATPGMPFTLPATPSLDFTDTVTIEAWFRTTAIPSGDKIAIVNGSTFSAELRAVGFRCALATEQAGDVPIPIDTWVHIACVKGPVESMLYVNGVPVASATTAGNLWNLGTLVVAQGATGIDAWVDSLRIYDVPRTAAEICAASGSSAC